MPCCRPHAATKIIMLLLRGSSYLPQAQSTAQGHLRVNLAALAANIVNGGTTAADCRALRATRHLGGRGQHAVVPFEGKMSASLLLHAAPPPLKPRTREVCCTGAAAGARLRH